MATKAKTSVVKTRAEQGTRELVCREVEIEGVTPIMFDRYAGDNTTKLLPSQKLYFGQNGTQIALPATNIMSFLSAKNTDSAPKRILDSKVYKKFTEACAAFVMISAIDDDAEEMLPILRDGKPIEFTGFGSDETCSSSGVFIRRDVARLEKGIPNPKERPVLPLSWSVRFRLRLFPNQQLQEQQLKNVFEQGGFAVGLGTWRGRFGKFKIVSWE